MLQQEEQVHQSSCFPCPPSCRIGSLSAFFPLLTALFFLVLDLLLIKEKQLQLSNSHSVLSSCQEYFGAGSSLLLLNQLFLHRGGAQKSCLLGLLPLAVGPGPQELLLLETMSSSRDARWRCRRNWVSSVMGRAGDVEGLQLLFFFQ